MSALVRNVLVLGAGFSKSISSRTPTMDNLTQALFGYEIPGAFPHLRSYVAQYVEAVCSEPGYVSIERLGTVLFGTELFASLSREHFIEGARLEFLRWLAESVRTAAVSVDPDKAAFLTRFLRLASVAYDRSFDSPGERIITLNYDLLLESLVERASADESDRRWRYDYYVQLAGDGPGSAADPGRSARLVFPCLKIHGSLNWYRVAGAERNDVTSVFQVVPGSVMDKVHRDDPPVFVPMAHARRAFLGGSLFPTLWRTMAYYLDHADAVTFLGYGFPDTDLTLLLEFARHKAKVRTIVICETPQVFRKRARRLQGLFPQAEVVNSDAYDWLRGRYPDISDEPPA